MQFNYGNCNSSSKAASAARRRKRADTDPTVVPYGTPAIDVNRSLRIMIVDVAVRGRAAIAAPNGCFRRTALAESRGRAEREISRRGQHREHRDREGHFRPKFHR